MRCAVVPPVPVPYREPLFAALAHRERLDLRVIYQSGAQPGWDQRVEWFPAEHAYPAQALGSHQRRRAGRTPVLLPRGLGRALSAFDPDCVVSWEYGAATLRSLAWCRRRGRRLVVFSELTQATEPALSAGRRRLQRVLIPRLDGFIAASTAARERLLALGAAPGRVLVSLQSADVDAFAAVAHERRPPAGRPVRVLAVGRLVPDKNHARLLAAFGAAGLAGRAELELCGTGPLEGELRAEAERRDLPVAFTGYVAPDELPAVYARADILALVSTFEPFGVAVREGAAAGLPIICSTAAGAAGDFAVADENALLVEPADTGAMAAALRRLVDDAPLRERLAAGSAAVSARHPLTADVEAFETAVLRAAER